MSKKSAVLLLATAALIGCGDDPAGLPDLVVESVQVAPTDRVVELGDTIRLTAYPRTADGVILGSARVDWSANDPSLAVIESDGHRVRIVAKQPGTLRMTARSEGRQGTATVVITPVAVPVIGLGVTPSQSRLQVGESVEIEVTMYGADGSHVGGRAVTWSSSDSTIATVHAATEQTTAVVTVHRNGRANISAAAEGFVAVAEVIVEAQAPAVRWVLVAPHSRAIWVDEVFQPQVQVLTPTGTVTTAYPVTWSAEDSTIVSVDGNGLLRGLATGETRVYAEAGGVVGQTTIRVIALPGDPATFDLQPGVDALGMPRAIVMVDSTTWVDPSGTEHIAALWLMGGSLTHFRDGAVLRYRQELELHLAVRDETTQQTTIVGVQRLVEEGEITYRLFDGDYMYTSDGGGEPSVGGYVEAGRLVLEQQLGSLDVLDYVYVLR